MHTNTFNIQYHFQITIIDTHMYSHRVCCCCWLFRCFRSHTQRPAAVSGSAGVCSSASGGCHAALCRVPTARAARTRTPLRQLVLVELVHDVSSLAVLEVGAQIAFLEQEAVDVLLQVVVVLLAAQIKQVQHIHNDYVR